MSDLHTIHPEAPTPFKALQKECDAWILTGDQKSRLTGDGIVVDCIDEPLVMIFVRLDAGEDELESLPGKAEELIIRARRLKISMEIARHREHTQ